MKITIHQTDHTIGDFEAIYIYCEDIINKNIDGLHLFPELFLTGYPLKDLCLQKNFISAYQLFLIKLNQLFERQKENRNQAYLMGGLTYHFEDKTFPSKITNCILLFTGGKKYQNIYTKRLLPNYDIFDEKKYFTAGTESIIWKFNEVNVALLICEDMWHTPIYTGPCENDPLIDLWNLKNREKKSIDLIINLSASPFYLGKEDERIKRALNISNVFETPLVYVNRVGGEDDILFDGNSFVVNNNALFFKAKTFDSEIHTFDLEKFKKNKEAMALATITKQPHTWKGLYFAHLNTKRPPQLSELSDNDCETILQSLMFGLQEYAKKSGMNNFLVANSGGIDSALVLTIAKLSLKNGQKLEALYMPGPHSATLSYELAYELAKNLKVKITSASIKFIHSAIKNSYLQDFNNSLKSIADENLQSRIRGLLLYAHSNQNNFLVINTSNKSELAVGYSTLYGDSVGAISLLGDLYKTEVYQLANYINKKFNNLIPEKIITRAPTAELRENQTDAQSLPPYDLLDPILEGILSYSLNNDELVAMGFESPMINRVYGLYMKSEFKRGQFCPIIKIKAKSFGFGYRLPISKVSK